MHIKCYVIIGLLLLFSHCKNLHEKDDQEKLHTFVHRMPKTDIHVHLEGSISPATLIKLAQNNNVKLPCKTEGELKEFFQFRNFSHFVEIYNIITSCLKTPDDYTLIAYEFGRAYAQQNIRYAEVYFTIATNCSLSGLPADVILKALNTGRDQAFKDFGVTWLWIFDIIRDQPETQTLTLDTAMQEKKVYKHPVALGFAGKEMAVDASVFAQTIKKAKQQNIPIEVHAGEHSDAESIWIALNELHAHRIGHGVRCLEDQELVKKLQKEQIPLAICISSNICLGIFPTIEQHVVRKLWDAGLFITISSDDPALFSTTLTQEYEDLVDYFYFTADELEKINLNGIHASFLPEQEKAKLISQFKEEFKQLRKEIIV